MESLALAAAIIVFSIIVLGVVATFTVIRTPKSALGRMVTLILNTIGIAAGAWLAALDIGMGARVIGAAVAVTNATSLVRILRSRAV
ncbi:MAG: hypothetical protein ACK45J_01530 [Acidimicrobiaceae bacterium]|jgi:hypothetical protein|nr:hypothetical protein [Ilumatobacteraceae bacterium]